MQTMQIFETRTLPRNGQHTQEQNTVPEEGKIIQFYYQMKQNRNTMMMFVFSFRYEYFIPFDYWQILRTNCQIVDINKFTVKQDDLDLFNETIEVLRNGLTDYIKYFHLLLWFDEAAQISGLNRYKMSQVHLLKIILYFFYE